MLTPDSARARAIALAGSDDFGPAGFEEGLERALAAFPSLPLTEAAQAAAEDKIVADLAMRLRIEQHYRDHPEIADTPVEGPVVVFGLPRTGTTATVAMMALDPRFRFLRAWEAMQPVPPPRLADEPNDSRAVAARAAVDYANQAQHLSDPDGPEEDLAMLAGLDMRSYHGAYPMPQDYTDWWVRADFASTYAYHRRVLTLLHSQRPPRLWLLKAPIHLFQLEAFAAEYPEARFVMTHRDPAKVIASDSSLRYRLHKERCHTLPDKTTYGPKLLAFWREGMDRALAARDRIGDHRFVDVYNRDVVAHPTETFERLYQGLGFDLTPDVRASLEDYTRRNARGAHGEHRYTAEEYGLTEQAIREAFADYIARFDL